MTILDEAAAITSGDRHAAYGHPADHHAATAAAVTAYLRRRGVLRDGAALEAGDWQMCMILDKVMRAAHPGASWSVRRDSLVDVCGYARTVEMVQQRAAVAQPESAKVRVYVPGGGNGHALSQADGSGA